MKKLNSNLMKNIITVMTMLSALMVSWANSALAAESKGKVLVVVSSLSEIPLQDGKTYTTGYFLNELAVPVKALVDAGYQPVFANPQGNAISWDTHSLDKKYFAGDEKQMNESVQFVKSLDALKKPISLKDVIKKGTGDYVGVFLPGGHAPLGDLAANTELGDILQQFHRASKPTALICHGPIALLSTLRNPTEFAKGMINGDAAARDTASQLWPYAGYRMTVFSTAEEKVSEQYQLNGKVKFYPAEALTEAGAIMETRKMWQSNVVKDRELITGQQPFSDEEFSKVFIAALNAQKKSQ